MYLPPKESTVFWTSVAKISSKEPRKRAGLMGSRWGLGLRSIASFVITWVV